MSQVPPLRPPRGARHRSSVHGPPPGAEAGTGYTIPDTPASSSPQFSTRLPETSSSAPLANTAPLNFNRISSPLSSRNIVRSARPDPNIYDPIDEPIRTPRTTRERRLQGAPSTGTSMMFYPSSTTLSSETSGRDDHREPLPFFRTDPFGSPRRAAAPNSEAQTQDDSSAAQNRTTSMRSSGVLGDGAIEVVSDSSDNESVSSYSSVERQIVRQVSTVRRGQAQIVRNPSQRKSIVADVSSRRGTEKLILGSTASKSTPETDISSATSSAAGAAFVSSTLIQISFTRDSVIWTKHVTKTYVKKYFACVCCSV